MGTQQQVKLTDIAKICGVSPATVSLVISNHPRISRSTRSKVLKVIKKTGYYPNSAARMLSTNNTKTICVVVPQISHIFSDPYFGEALSGIYDYLSKNDYKLLLEMATYEFCFYKKYLQVFREKRVDGMLYVGSTLKDDYLVDFEKEKLPFILVGSYFPHGDKPRLDFVTGDNFEGGYIATKHLLDLGHKRIGVITGNFNVVSARDRFMGYKRALKEYGIPFENSLWVKADFNEQTGFKAMETLLDRKNEKITAVFAGNDLMALGAIRAVRERGLKVPEDVAVVGMDNIRIPAFEHTSLTTVDYNVYEMGRLASRRIIEKIEKKTTGRIAETLPVKLIIRETCGANLRGKTAKK